MHLSVIVLDGNGSEVVTDTADGAEQKTRYGRHVVLILEDRGIWLLGINI